MKLLVLLCSLILVLAYLILQPQEKVAPSTLDKTKEFGAFLSTHATFASGTDSVIHITAEPQSLPAEGKTISALTPEQSAMIDDATRGWTLPEFTRDDRFRSQMENMLDLSEKTHSLDLLDKIRSQIIAASFDSLTQVSESSQAWIERYMRLETRENFLQQMREVHR